MKNAQVMSIEMLATNRRRSPPAAGSTGTSGGANTGSLATSFKHGRSARDAPALG